jgi:acetyl-CoA carboxylase carboxyl transferase subunit alpha
MAKTQTAYDRVKTVRGNKRPTALSYIDGIFRNFFEFHGDRRYADDAAIVGGIGWINDIPFTVIGMEKGNTTKERVKRNFASPNPEGYRKALRLMKQAEKFHRPVVCFVDTSGAFPGIGAEERGQGQAIAENLFELSDLATPILTVFIGEGGSGGALALAVADEVWMLENAVYSVISPEGCASILMKDAAKAPQVAEYLKLRAEDALSLKVCDRILPEKGLGEPSFYDELSQMIFEKCKELTALPMEELVAARYNRFRIFGV